MSGLTDRLTTAAPRDTSPHDGDGAQPAARRRRAPYVLSGLALAAGIGNIGLESAAGILGPEPGYLVLLVSMTLTFSGFTLVGALTLTRSNYRLMGWLLLASGLVATFFPLLNGIATYGWVRTGEPRSWIVLGSLVGGLHWMLWLALLLVFLPLVYPDGRFLSDRWRRFAYAPAVGLAVFQTFIGLLYPTIQMSSIEGVTFDNPIGVDLGEVGEGVIWVGVLPLVVVSVLVALTSVVVRYRRSIGDERAQMKWFLFAVVANAFAALVSTTVVHDPWPLAMAMVGIPAAIGIAVLKYRLYDIDVVISKTVVFAGLAAFITAIYVGIVVGVGTLLGAGSEPNLALSIVATAVVAVAFQPVRERLTRLANRLLFGRRATPYEVLSLFSEHLGEVAAPQRTLQRMARLLADGTGAARAQVWLRSAEQLEAVATWPAHMTDDSEPGHLVEVVHEGQTLGALSVDKQRGETLTPADVKLVDDLAAQAGLVLRNLRLTEDLKARIVELQASRQRLVSAQDAERRRLERDLHDGAQRQLVQLKTALTATRAVADREQAIRAGQLLDQLTGDADDAVATLRELAHGIFPPLLAAEGLAGALTAQAAKAAVPVRVETDGVGRYTQDVEAAVYFCVLEAVQNAAKYASPSQVTVRLADIGGHLTFEVRDDGAGFDPATTTKGAGTTNMADRLDALGGRLELDSRLGSGTVVQGEIPTNTAPRQVPA